MLKTLKYRLYPSRHQIGLLEQTTETCCRWFNACLTERKDAGEDEKRSVCGSESARARTECVGPNVGGTSHAERAPRSRAALAPAERQREPNERNECRSEGIPRFRNARKR